MGREEAGRQMGTGVIRWERMKVESTERDNWNWGTSQGLARNPVKSKLSGINESDSS